VSIDRLTDFFLPGPASDAEYVELRDGQGERTQEARAFIEEMWFRCGEFLDADLRDRARRNFSSAFWELYLAFAFYANDVHLVPRSERRPARSGPDLLIREPPIWIEAVAPGPGEGADRVPDLTGIPGAHAVPDERIKLRLRSAIEEKHDRLLAYEKRGWVRPDEPAIVAVGGAGLGLLHGDLNVPRIVRVAFGIGFEQLHIDLATRQVVGSSYLHSPAVRKQSGEEVSTDLFVTPAYRRISALLYSPSDALNRPTHPGADLILVLNPHAAAPITRGWFHFMHEYHAEGDKVHHRQAGSA
jgi:type I restriction enzyme S subunit